MATDNALSDLRAIEIHVSIEYDNARALLSRSESRILNEQNRFEQLLFDLDVCVNVMKMLLYRSGKDENHLILSYASTRADVVYYAHIMSLAWNSPALVTTPGSSFSTLCSLLYEIASGRSDEGLPGAINRYARSAQRKKIEEEKIEIDQEIVESDRDNFYFVKQGIKIILQECYSLNELLSDSTLDAGVRSLVAAMLLGKIEEAESVAKRYGPNLIWAYEVWPGEHAERLAEIEALRVRDRRLEVELGELRRKNRSADRPN